jgi:hypothetical protein
MPLCAKAFCSILNLPDFSYLHHVHQSTGTLIDPGIKSYGTGGVMFFCVILIDFCQKYVMCEQAVKVGTGTLQYRIRYLLIIFFPLL